MTTDKTGQPDPPDDPQFDALLRRTLAPERVGRDMPADLADRIVAATRYRLNPAGRAGVIARIGPPLVRAVVAAAVIGVVVTVGSIINTARSLVDLQTQLNQLTAYTGPDAAIDEQLQLLATEIDLALANADLDDYERFEDELAEWQLELEPDLSGLF